MRRAEVGGDGDDDLADVGGGFHGFVGGDDLVGWELPVDDRLQHTGVKVGQQGFSEGLRHGNLLFFRAWAQHGARD